MCGLTGTILAEALTSSDVVDISWTKGVSAENVLLSGGEVGSGIWEATSSGCSSVSLAGAMDNWTMLCCLTRS
jgi:hypothetical protein